MKPVFAGGIRRRDSLASRWILPYLSKRTRVDKKTKRVDVGGKEPMIVTVKVKAADGKLRLSSIRPEILDVFTITRLDKIFDIKPTTDAALEGF